jgi:ATP-dependent RNA helicase DHX29
MDRVDEAVINYDLIEDLLELVLIRSDHEMLVLPEGADMTRGAVLVFLPGIGEIRSLSDRLRSSRVFGNRSSFDIVALHSSLSSTEQKRAFQPSPRGCRKIIVSTNVAETSVTIPDVVCGMSGLSLCCATLGCTNTVFLP